MTDSFHIRRAPILDGRLSAAKGLAGNTLLFADIGADHGRLSTVLLCENCQRHALVADISAPALQKARSRIQWMGLADRATFAVADGLAALDTLDGQTPDTVFVLGMGGDTVSGILMRGASRLNGAVLILGAQTELPLVRKALCAIDYRIRRELVVNESGRDYILIRAEKALPDEPVYSEEELLLGPVLMKELPQTWLSVLKRRERLLRQGIEAMSSSSNSKDGERLNLFSRELEYTVNALNRLSERKKNVMKVHQIIDWLNAIAPFESAESFDNVGLLMGDSGCDVHKVLFGMDITETLVEEAVSIGAELIITHHPFIFHALKRIDYSGPQGRALCKLVHNGISVIAAHTNWDKAAGGISDSLAAALGLQDVVAADDYIRIGTLPAPLSHEAFAQLIQDNLHIVPRCYPACGESVRTVAVAGGAYGEGYLTAVHCGAQAYVVGEAAHHEILDAFARGLTLCDAGHYATEMPGVRALYQRFLADAKLSGWPVEAHLHHKAPYAGATMA